MTLVIYDDASSVASTLARLQLAKEAGSLITERSALTSSTSDVLRALKIGVRLRDIALALGLQSQPAVAEHPEPATTDQAATTGRVEPTADLYPDEGKRTLAQRQRDNNAAIAMLRDVQSGARALDDDARAVLAKYSGNGGGLVGADGLSGSPHEYYTPKPIASAMWNLLGELGFTGGAVLDPSAGSGIFTATRPAGAVMTQVELDETSGAINAAVNDGPTVSTTVSPFEAIAANTPDEIFDAVITNVPFGTNAMRGGNEKKDPRFQKANLQEYFIQRTLQKLKPGGLAAFIVPKQVVSGMGGKECKLRRNVSLMAEFVGAYRLPNSIFTTAAANVTTDLIVFRKFTREAALKIEELLAQSPAVLTDAKVLWDEFLAGHYFKGEGVRFVLGEHGVTNGRFGMVEAVINDDSISNIAKLIRRFPGGSRIDWDLLNTAETAPIVYSDGDIIRANGQTLQMRDGQWSALSSDVEESRETQAVGPKLQTALDAVNNGIRWEQADRYAAYQTANGNYDNVPAWLVATRGAIASLGAGDMQKWWEAISAGMAAMQLMQASSSVEPFNYLDTYPVLSAQLAKSQAFGAKTIRAGNRLVKDALLSIRNARYKNAFTPFWLGEIQANLATIALTPTQLYEKARYEGTDETGYVPVAKLREAFSDFDPLESDEWCISPDGLSVTHANDYYSGTYAAFLARADGELRVATDPAIRAKIERQVARARERINIVDVSTMTFSLFTPHVTSLQKLDFLKQYVSPHIFLTTDADGNEVFDIAQPGLSKHSSEEQKAAYKALQRFVKGYLRNQNITTMSKSVEVESDPVREAALLRRIKEITDRTKAQFDAWARANEEIQVSLHNKLNDPAALRFIEEPDGTPLDIPNLNIETFRPHPYQFAAARRYARDFSGILGFDVGLGKTLTALASVQYVHSIGAKKKTIFVVPNATLTNWEKETGKAYQDVSDCLFVGLVTDKKGEKKVDNTQVKIDLNAIRENRHSKIFMTIEAFKLIPLRDETMDAYIAYLTDNDDAYAIAEQDAGKKRAAIAAESQAGKVKDMGEKSGALPYFEDMGVDSLVLDEAHNYKNSKTTSSEFKSAKYLADSLKSQRGMDMQAKAWFVRGLSSKGDGVLSLTATPVTNSPLEVYSMLTLSLGERAVNAMYGVTGADSFMAAACDIDEREEENIVGMMRPVRVFTGLQNANLLRRLLQTSCLIKTADDVKADGVNITVPEHDEIATGVDIGEKSFALIMAYKDAYLKAAERLKAGNASGTDKLTASPFNLIRKMTRVINDPELNRGIMAFKFPDAQRAAALRAVEAFNNKAFVEERETAPVDVDPNDVRTKIVKDAATGESVSKFFVTVRARVAEGANAVELMSTDYSAQELLLKLLAANGIEPDVEVSPKIAALIENVRAEAAAPRHMGLAKQIIFCDELSLHHKIRIAIAKAVSVPLSKIKIVNAVAVDVAGMQDVQDGFNADGKDNRYEYIVVNKKGEVGINLQKGTQAIHHLTIGWTPDSIHQRNGRGVRQGNPIDRVNVYHYDANGTFDAYKRKLVGIKADWIGSLMRGDSSKIQIDGDMSSEDYELLASAVGDAEAMNRANAEITERNKRQRQAASRVAQLQSLRIVDQNAEWLKQFGAESGDGKAGFAKWVQAKIDALRATRVKVGTLRERMGATESDLMRARLSSQMKDLSVTLDAQLAVLGGLRTDASGNPLKRDPRDAITEQDRGTVAYANWQKDVTIAQRMKREAAVSFNNKSDDGFSKDVLASFEEGNAVIAMGTVVTVGSFVEHEGTLYVALKAKGRDEGTIIAYNPATDQETPLLRLNGATFTLPGMPGWSVAVSRAVALDADMIRQKPDGFGVGSRLLFSSFVDDVRTAYPDSIPSAELRPSSFAFLPPTFPYLMSSGAPASPFVDYVRAGQAPMITEETPYGTVRIDDLRMIGPAADTTVSAYVENIRQFCAAHGVRATATDLKSISPRLDLPTVMDESGTTAEFMRALPDGVAVCKTPEALDAWAEEWLARHVPWLVAEQIENVFSYYTLRQYRAKRNAIDDGTERWFLMESGMKYRIEPAAKEALQAAMKAGKFVDEVLSAAADSAYYMPQSFHANGMGRRLAELLFEEDDYIELKVAVEQVRAAMLLNSRARLYVENWGDAVTLAMSIFVNCWNSMVGWAKRIEAERKVDEAGLDLDGVLKALRAAPGVASASLATVDVWKTADRYTGAYSYKAGGYLNIALERGSPAFIKVASPGAAGLEGRTFDKELKAFRFTVSDNEKFSDGKKVASVADVFAKLGMNFAEYQV
ncbi:N-6 DNA methylase [Burkholderia gladioli]|uniref:N-6 DNA methylase n=1 Tax=Burkholderia gladioli TaxID=28095 RepID=UPI00163ED28E|nr:N-6 DNA methylase [Burkholderia gladioli]